MKTHSFIGFIPMAPTLILAFTWLTTGCSTPVEIRIENQTSYTLSKVNIEGIEMGDLSAGQTSSYQVVPLRWRYAVMQVQIDQTPLNAQSLNLGSRRFTHIIRSVDVEKGHFDIEVVRD